MSKLSYEAVDDLHLTLHAAFTENLKEDEEPTQECFDKISSIFNVFLIVAGWTEQEYWDTYHELNSNDVCNECLEKESN